MISNKLKKFVSNYVPISERIIAIQVNTTPVKLNLVQVYATTADKCDNKVEQFHGLLTNTFKQLNKKDLTVVLGDLNAKIGKAKTNHLVGNFGLGLKNKRGDRLIQLKEVE